LFSIENVSEIVLFTSQPIIVYYYCLNIIVQNNIVFFFLTFCNLFNLVWER